VLICICVVVGRVDVDWSDAFEGYLPSKYILQNGAVYISTGIIGATIMPHSLFLGSALATQDRIEFNPLPDKDPYDEDEGLRRPLIARCWRFLVDSFKTPPRTTTTVKRHCDRENNSFGFVKAHLYHNVTDIVTSLLGFAVLINSA
jgi:metal iron transporter